MLKKMFAAGSNLKGKTAEEIFFRDFKTFATDQLSFGVGRLTSPNRGELESLQQELLPFMEEVRRRQHMDMISFSC